MNKRIIFIRVCYWIGAILDGRAAIKLIYQRYIDLPVKVNELVSGREFIDSVYSVGQGVALMLGWTFLLIWADRKPVGRRGVLLLTVIPVLFGLIANSINGILCGFTSLNSSFPLLIGQFILVSLFITGYIFARSIENNNSINYGAHDLT